MLLKDVTIEQVDFDHRSFRNLVEYVGTPFRYPMIATLLIARRADVILIWARAEAVSEYSKTDLSGLLSLTAPVLTWLLVQLPELEIQGWSHSVRSSSSDPESSQALRACSRTCVQ